MLECLLLLLGYKSCEKNIRREAEERGGREKEREKGGERENKERRK